MHNGELHVFYSSLNIVQIIKSRRMEWAVRVAHRGRIKMPTRFW
jgi:hypothetical protein